LRERERERASKSGAHASRKRNQDIETFKKPFSRLHDFLESWVIEGGLFGFGNPPRSPEGSGEGQDGPSTAT